MNEPSLLFNLDFCTGCATCRIACQDGHDLPPQLSLITIRHYRGGDYHSVGQGWRSRVWSLWLPLPCAQCREPACREVCPVGAIDREAPGRPLIIDSRSCTGCGSCVESCPLGAVHLVPEKEKAVKCDLCSGRLAAGSLPLCVEACPMKVIECGEHEVLAGRYPAGEMRRISSCSPGEAPETGSVLFRLSRSCAGEFSLRGAIRGL